MPGPLAGRTIALAEGRQQEQLIRLLTDDGATALAYPLLNILDAPEPEPVVDWLRGLIAGRFDFVVLMTGEALTRLLALAEREGCREDFVAALARTFVLTRGPKPARVLKEIGLAPTRSATQPTTDGVIAALRDEPLAGRVVAYTLSGVPNPALEQFLIAAGADPRAVLPYVYATGSSSERVRDLLERMAAGSIDVLIFTSSPQVERLFEAAKELGATELLETGRKRVRIAAVGPVVAETLRTKGWPATICPEQGWVMKNLVQHIKRDFQENP